MSDELNLSLSRTRDAEKQEGQHGPGNGERTESGRRIGEQPKSTKVIGTGVPYSESLLSEPPPARSFDPIRLLDSLTRRWYVLLASGLIAGTLALAVGTWLTDYRVRVPLLRRSAFNAFNPNASEGMVPDLSLQTLFRIMKSPEVLQNAGTRLEPPLSSTEVASAVQVFGDRDPEFINLLITGKDPNRLVELANVYADIVLEFTKNHQANEAGEISRYLQQRLQAVEQELAAVDAEVARFARDARVLNFEKEIEAHLSQRKEIVLLHETARIDLDTLGKRIARIQELLKTQSPMGDRLQAAKDEYQFLRLSGKSEAHPDVVQAKLTIQNLEKFAKDDPTNSAVGFTRGNTLANSLYLNLIDLESQKSPLEAKVRYYETQRKEIETRAEKLSEKAADFASIKAQRQRLEVVRGLYADRQREAELLEKNALGYFKIYARATPESVEKDRRYLIIGALTVAGTGTGVILSVLLLLLTELVDSRIKTVADMRRITKLPVFATLGDLRAMSPTEQINWAFRTLTILQGKLNGSPDKSLICGFISSQHGEGRSTWINLLVNAASQRGLRVLTVATKSSTAADSTSSTEKTPSPLPVGPRTMLNNNVLTYPAQVAEQFNDPDAQPVVHIPLPGWVWNLERRKHWQSALTHWRQIENLVLLIELPPACQPESILLAENLPQVIWLAQSGAASADETRQHLETLRHAQCQVVGAVLNQAPESIWGKLLTGLTRRTSAAALGLAACLAATALAAEAEPQITAAAQPAATPQPEPRTVQPADVATARGSFSAVKPAKRAPWQERLSLGPGDVLDLTVYRRPELTRTNVVVGPDGRLSFLQAQDVPVAGLTVDELRSKLAEELGRFYDAAAIIVTPVTFNSKKYFVLGKVVDRGAFTLDRPLTILEAVARARGLETGWLDRNTVETADLSRSFLVRQGKRVSVDFERLFRQGDFSQNIFLEPNDYLYFPASDLREIYVLGEVLNPGATVFTPEASVVTALTATGGFAPKAYKRKVLVVRGSLNQPETFIVNTVDVLDGRAPDFKLQPRDIVYVSARPWAKVEELLDLAAEAFIQAAVTAWVGSEIRPFIKDPIIK